MGLYFSEIQLLFKQTYFSMLLQGILIDIIYKKKFILVLDTELLNNNNQRSQVANVKIALTMLTCEMIFIFIHIKM